MNDDRESLVDVLKLDRQVKPPRRKNRLPLLVLAVIILVALAIAALYEHPWDNKVSVTTFEVEAPSISARSVLDASGYVVPRLEATLSAKILGKLIYVGVEEGDHVAKGQIVARLDDSNYSAALLQAQAQVQQAKVALVDARSKYIRYENLWGQKAISTDSYEDEKTAYDAARTALAVAEAARGVAQANENDTVVRVPFAGVVTDKAAQVGEIVAPAAAGGGFTRTGIATIVDMNSLEVQVDVSEDFIDRVHAGQKAVITLNAYPNWKIPASVIAVIPSADESKGTVTVRVAIGTRDTRILPQMGARVSFLVDNSLEHASRGLLIPRTALLIRGHSDAVFVIKDNTAELRRIQIAAKASTGSITVLNGLRPGEQVATSNISELRNGSKVLIRDE